MSVPKWLYLEITRGTWIKIDAADVTAVRSSSWRQDRKRQKQIRLLTTMPRSMGHKTLSLERFLLKPVDGFVACKIKPELVDDFRRSNLMICTIQVRQQRLCKRTADLTSIYKGVSYEEASDRWRASIQNNGHSKFLGTWASEKEAAKAYDRAVEAFNEPCAFKNFGKT